MKKFIAFSLMALMVFAVGCDLESLLGTEDEDDEAVETLDGEMYFPFAQDYELVYNTESSDTTETEVATETFVGQETIEGNSYWKLVSDSGDTSYLRFDDNKLKAYLKTPPWNGYGGQSADPVEVTIADFDLEEGDTWTIFEKEIPGSMGPDSTITTINWTGEYAGLEDVTVAVDTYEEAPYFKTSLEIKYGVISSTMSAPIPIQSKSIDQEMYFGENVGPVKTSDTIVMDTRGSIETIEYMKELAYWNRPGGGSGGTDPR
jgi:hypothetical protein